MKLVFKVAKTELRNLFYSPVAWFLTLVFLIFAALMYTLPIGMLATFQEALKSSSSKFEGFPFPLTNGVITSLEGFGLFGSVFRNIYMFIPLLTMGLISREFNSGTFKLLYSSPVKIRQIVWGKYLAIMVYNGLLSLIMIMFMIIASFTIKDIEYVHMIACVLTFYLVVCAFTSIGMFMSSVSNYPIVSALATFVLLMALQNIGGLWQDYDFVRDLTYFLSINGRINMMSNGLITTKDVMYYVLIAVLFVSFTYLRLRHGREQVSKATKFLRYSSIFIIVVTIGYLTSRPGYIGYWDATRNKTNTIKETTQEILSRMDKNEPLEVTMYTNLLDWTGFSRTRPSQRNNYVWNIWDRYVRFKKNIKLDYVLYYDVKDGDSGYYKQMPNMTLDSIAMEIAKMNEANYNRFLKPAEIRKQIDFSDENMKSIMLLKYKGKSIYLRMYPDSKFWPDEVHFAAAFKRLVTDSIPKAYYSVGQLERTIHKSGEREYRSHSILKDARPALINNGFEIDTVNLNVQDIPADAHALVVADPRVEFTPAVMTKLTEHLNNGGNMLIMGEPRKQHVLNPLLAHAGVKLQDGALVQITKDETPDKIVPLISDNYATVISKHREIIEIIIKNKEDGDTIKSLNPGAVAVEFDESKFKASRLWVTNPGKVWVKMGKLVTDSAAPVLEAREGDYKLDSFTVAVALEREINNKQQRVVVVGDADYLSNMRGQYNGAGLDYISWMNNQAYPIKIFEKPFLDNQLIIGETAAELQSIILLWVLPAVVLILGIVILIRRKRQ